jgi:hypothetical protein
MKDVRERESMDWVTSSSWVTSTQKRGSYTTLGRGKHKEREWLKEIEKRRWREGDEKRDREKEIERRR